MDEKPNMASNFSNGGFFPMLRADVAVIRERFNGTERAASAMAVLAALRDIENERRDSSFVETVGVIAFRACVSHRTAQSRLHDLVEVGLLSAFDPGAGGIRTKRRYTLTRSALFDRDAAFAERPAAFAERPAAFAERPANEEASHLPTGINKENSNSLTLHSIRPAAFTEQDGHPPIARAREAFKAIHAQCRRQPDMAIENTLRAWPTDRWEEAVEAMGRHYAGEVQMNRPPLAILESYLARGPRTKPTAVPPIVKQGRKWAMKEFSPEAGEATATAGGAR